MIILLLAILVSPDLAFANLTLGSLTNWLNLHPFITCLIVLDLLSGSVFLANILTSMTLNSDCHKHEYLEDAWIDVNDIQGTQDGH